MVDTKFGTSYNTKSEKALALLRGFDILTSVAAKVLDS